jgi:PAS domain S-box-containing protein
MVSFKIILGVLFALLVSCIVIWGAVSYQNNKTSIEAAGSVRHTHEVIEQANEISSLFKDIQLESNAFFISDDSSFLTPYRNVRDSIVPSIEKLRLLTRDNPDQGPRIDSLLSDVRELISFTDRRRDGQGTYTIQEFNERLTRNYEYRNHIRKVIESIREGEESLLANREVAYKDSIAAFNRTFLLLMLGIAVLLATTFILIRYNFNRRIKAQDEQRKANELFAKLFYDSPIGIVISRLGRGEIIDCNHAYTELLGFTKPELLGKTAVELGIINTTAERNEIVKGARSRGINKDIEVQLNRKDSNPIWVSISMQSIQIDDENCLLSAILDMTAHKDAEDKIRKALATEKELNKLKSNFVTLASHEFRTPLTAILSSASLLENYSSGENKSKVNKHVARIKASVNLLTSILDEFLSITKIEEGKVEPKTELLNLKETLESLCNNLKTFARPGQTIIYKHIGDEEIYSDPVLLGNIVNNLVSNAIKYSHDNSEILVSSFVNANIHLSVKDHGIGISKEDQVHLFERFFRASNAGDIQGTGLGLHIMKHYVDRLKGSIEVQSELGNGSEFKVILERQKLGES